jgi:hypothetical protein
MNRFKMAIECQDACNGQALVRDLVRKIDDLKTEHDGWPATDTIHRDPALRLIVYKIATLFAVDALSMAHYVELEDECLRRAQ